MEGSTRRDWRDGWHNPVIVAYRIRYPPHFETDGQIIEAKGWFLGVVVEVDGVEHYPMFYDPDRLSQECADAVARNGFFYEQNIVVVPRVTRDHIEAAVDKLSRSGFEA